MIKLAWMTVDLVFTVVFSAATFWCWLHGDYQKATFYIAFMILMTAWNVERNTKR